MALNDQPLKAELDRIRAELDEIDHQLVAALARRFEVGAVAARVKRGLGIAVHDPVREQQVIDQAVRWAREAHLPEKAVEDLFRRMIVLSRNSQIAATEDDK